MTTVSGQETDVFAAQLQPGDYCPDFNDTVAEVDPNNRGRSRITEIVFTRARGTFQLGSHNVVRVLRPAGDDTPRPADPFLTDAPGRARRDKTQDGTAAPVPGSSGNGLVTGQAPEGNDDQAEGDPW